MRCPKCESAMVGVEHAGITVDRCTACGGLWFDGTDHLDLKKAGGAGVIDGTTSVARAEIRMDAEPAIVHCPACGAQMETRFDAYQHHIHYETCPAGHGVYFDAGEFRDFVTDDWSDFFKGLFSNYPGN